ncbi:uncharacterized protein LOC110809419 [Carica papaya]|uniref:uncharacterized protein LOC110809419 n=1 Tax=Carica papaya TaxID=3649 RepID=UPI000B8D0E1A|nr:uncharacterized protein LOC110809419 [Carica papaya]
MKKARVSMGLDENSRLFGKVWVILLVIFAPVSVKSEDSIYDHLRRQGLPIGLFPKGITDFSVDTKTGRFTVNLTRPCNAKYENQLHYDFNISGLLSYSKIGELSGVTQQELFLWFPVKGIRVDVPSSGLIYFDVGVVDKQFSLSLFESPRDCAAVDPDPSFSDEFQSLYEKIGYITRRGNALRAVS